MHISIRQIDCQQTMSLRHEVLWPNKSVEHCRVPGDDDAWHIGAFVENNLVSVASVFSNGKTARLRKFATAAAYQGKGIGSAVLTHLLTELNATEVEEFGCDARESALEFYQRFGMQAEGCRFYKHEVSYFKMSIRLDRAQ